MKNSMMRQSTGNSQLDDALGGGLLPGTLTVVVGASGVGKTQLGLSWLSAATGDADKESGGSADLSAGWNNAAIMDLSSRGDSQNHIEYASRLFRWPLSEHILELHPASELFHGSTPGNLVAIMGYQGHRVLRSQMDVDHWHQWQSNLNKRIPMIGQFVYQHLIRGTRRFLIDGIEPQDSPEDSVQMDLVETIYHRMLRKEHDWLAREVLRQDFRAYQDQVSAAAFNHIESSAVVLVTTRETMLDQLITRSMAAGDLSAGANTVILMGRVLEGSKMGRGLYIAKHRGSACEDNIMPFQITSEGLKF